MKKKGGKKKGKGAAASEDTHRCFHCDSEGAKMCCSQCKRAWYCGKPCQKKHWKLHKRPCVAPVELPCGHAYCGACLAELRTKKVVQACPLCRASLPPGVGGLYELATRAIMRIRGMVKRGVVSWASLVAEQEEIDEAIAMLTEAVAQGHAVAGFELGRLLVNKRQDTDGAEAAYRAAIAADLGYADAHYNLGILLEDERQDMDGAEAAYRAAVAADPGDAQAHNNLGTLLVNERQDMDGAEAAYRAAIAADPGDAQAHLELGAVLVERAQQIEGSDGDLAVAAALYDECAQLLGFSQGADHERTKAALANAARVRRALA